VDANETPGVESAYVFFDIGECGAVVVVRPDGHVGTAFALDELSKLGSYFDGLQ